MARPSDPLSRLTAVAERWRPGVEAADAVIAAAPIAALAATLDLDAEPIVNAGEVPPFWHWLYFLAWPSASALGEDGHPTVGPLLPPLPARRRMFAGGRLAVLAPLEIGAAAHRAARVVSVRPKLGRGGALLFVTVRAELSQSGRIVIVDEQDLVYRSESGTARAPSVRPPAEPDTGEWRGEPIVADARLLFRFSALTANSHRIHYDGTYATLTEGFIGLVVHGPLQAMLLAEQVRQRCPARRLTYMQYRFLRPAFAGSPLTIVGEHVPFDRGGPPVGAEVDDVGVRMRIVGPDGTEHAEADVRLAVPKRVDSR